LGIGLLGTGLTTGAVVAAFVVGPEELVGFEGLMTILHVAPVGAPGLVLAIDGSFKTGYYCFQ
jgi:hypothetical protein